MTTETSLACRCGKVSGTAKLVPAGMRLACYCRSCQAYVRFLQQAGAVADEHAVLDEQGGTEIYQLTPSQLNLTEGADQLRCIRISPKGPVRWYTDCCKTPVANTLSASWIPFVGVSHPFIGPADEASRQQLFGPVRYRVHARFAKGEVAGGHPSGPPALLAGTALRLLSQWLRGLSRPSPFLDASGHFVSQPRLLTKAERAAIGL